MTFPQRLLESIAGDQKRKIFFSFLLTILLYGMVSAQNSADIIVQPGSTQVSLAQNFVVTVKVDFTTPPATSSVDAVEIYLTFDKTKLAVASITKPAAGILPNEAISLQPIGTINSNGQINYAAFALSNFPTTDFDFLTITFNVIGGAGTTTPLNFLTTFPNKTDAQRAGTSILGSIGNGTVEIDPCTPPSATITAASGASTCNGQAVPVTLSGATGTSPFSLVVNGTTYTGATVGNVFANIPFPTYSIWPSNPTPAVPNNNDGQSVEVGLKFRTSQAGFIKGIRFYNGGNNSGTYTGKLWNYGTGTLIASAVFTGVSTNGWQQVLFSSPVPVSPNTTYIASYFSTAGNYAVTDDNLTSAVTNGPLTALADNGVSGPNGVYKYGGGMPTDFFSASNYWVDVVFASNTNTINLTSVTDATGCNVTGSLQSINVFSADCSTLPVTLLNLSATPGSRKVTLRWTTSSENNNRGFDVQRSTDGADWTTIGFVAGAGNSISTKSYTYTDNNLEPRKYFYRLKQVDFDERFKYSVIVSANLNGNPEFVLGQSYPNPTKGQATIQFTLPKAEKVNISLFDVSGRLMKVLVNGSKEAGTHAINFNVGTLSKGVYYYKMQAGDFSDVKKLTIQ
jgi:hypothetical protein